MKIKVNSEIGRLKKVLLHRPGLEVERHYPAIFEQTLFDDIMYVKNAQKEHDVFAQKLRDNGVEVFYIEQLVADVFNNNYALRNQFLKQFINEGGITNQRIFDALFAFFNAEPDNLKFVQKVIAGVLKSEVKVTWDDSIASHTTKNDPYPFYLEPLPNLLFQRDAIASIFNGINIHNMMKPIRKREGIFYEYLLKHHPEWQQIETHFERDHEGNMEGGDILVMSKETLFVGVSERTTAEAIEQLALTLFSKYPDLKAILGLEIPKQHETMHLDVMLTQMDDDKFLVDIDMAQQKYQTYALTFSNKKLKIASATLDIKAILQKYVHPQPQLFIVGNNKVVAARAERWTDGANCLTLQPGVIFVYDRNVYTNQLLAKSGIKTLEIPSGELSRGRGGPRCMAMPLERD